MDNESISWAAVCRDAAREFSDEAFLVNMIERQKNGTAALPSTPRPSLEGKKRAKISPLAVGRALEFPNAVKTPEQRELYTEFMHSAAMNSAPPAATKKNAANVNTTDGNIFKDAAWANNHLAPKREANLVCTSGPGPSSYFDNPTKAVSTLFNWHEIRISETELSKIEHIDSLVDPERLAASIVDAFRRNGVTMTRGTKEFADVFACTDPERHPILVVAVAKVHAQYEKDEGSAPKNKNFTVLLLVFQSEHVCLPFLNTNMNLHLGTMIQNKDYRKNVTFAKYMKVIT